MRFTFLQLLLGLGVCLTITNAVPLDRQSRSSDDVVQQAFPLAARDLVIDDEVHDQRRDDEEVPEKRQQFPVGIFGQLEKAVSTFVTDLKGAISKDKQSRSKYTVDFVTSMRREYPAFNWVMCHTSHIPEFDGVEGTDWGHTHEEFPISFDRTIGYEVYWGRTGRFVREGDGGYLNWAYDGNVASISEDGKVISWAEPN